MVRHHDFLEAALLGLAKFRHRQMDRTSMLEFHGFILTWVAAGWLATRNLTHYPPWQVQRMAVN